VQFDSAMLRSLVVIMRFESVKYLGKLSMTPRKDEGLHDGLNGFGVEVALLCHAWFDSTIVHRVGVVNKAIRLLGCGTVMLGGASGR
jgi:hypothetical protein